jgi:hypothetical protein
VELFLNLAGALVGLGLVCLWLRTSRNCDDRSRRTTQLVALALLILILFPVISVTDDLIAAQNPAETDSVQRRHLEVSMLQAAIVCAELPLDNVRTPDRCAEWTPLAHTERISLPQTPALAPIENRPPPTV